MKSAISFLALIAAIGLFTACSDGSSSEISDSQEPTAELIEAEPVGEEEAPEPTEAETELEIASPEPPIDAAPTDEELAQHNDFHRETLTQVREHWKDLPSPVEMTFLGFSWGDYIHISFSGPGDKVYDFGDGDNNFEGFSEDDFQNEESPYNGKKFLVHWTWKMSSFPCCQGQMDAIEAKAPSIVKLELIEE